MTAVDPQLRRNIQGWRDDPAPTPAPTSPPDQDPQQTECGYVSGNPFHTRDAEALVCLDGLECSVSDGFVGCCQIDAPCDIATTCVDYNASTTVSPCGQGTLCCPSTRPICNYLDYQDVEDIGMMHCDTTSFPPGVLYNTYNPFTGDRYSDDAIGETSIGANTARGLTSKTSTANKYKKCMIIIGGIMGGMVLLGAVFRLGQRCKRRRAIRRRQSAVHVDAERPPMTTRQTAPASLGSASLGTATISHLASPRDSRRPSVMFSLPMADALLSSPNPPPYSPLRVAGSVPRIPSLDIQGGGSPRDSSFPLFGTGDSILVQPSLAPGSMPVRMPEAANITSETNSGPHRAGSSSVGHGVGSIIGRSQPPSQPGSTAVKEQGHQRAFPLDAGGRTTGVEEG
ncbi:hypothetical protein QBC39DRAFT_344624 [Podospora conica]|nr:hypothetical protein QBC39DRAFT_344624 [Schizothecium conicum]